MRRVLVLSGLVSALLLATYLGSPPSVQADPTYCTTTCSSGAVLTCCATTRCSTVAGTSVTCDGVVMRCSTVNPWYLCKADCDEWAANCFDACEFNCNACGHGYTLCIDRCGPKPTTNIGC